jgi:hypothetical protein
MPKGYWIASGQFFEGIGKPLGNAQIPAVSQKEPSAKTWQFPSFFSEVSHFCLYLSKVKETVENFKNLQRFFSSFCSFHPYHF